MEFMCLLCSGASGKERTKEKQPNNANLKFPLSTSLILKGVDELASSFHTMPHCNAGNLRLRCCWITTHAGASAVGRVGVLVCTKLEHECK